MPEAPRSPSTPPTARRPGDLAGGERTDQSGPDAAPEIAAAQAAAEALGNTAVISSPELPPKARMFGFEEAPADRAHDLPAGSRLRRDGAGRALRLARPAPHSSHRTVTGLPSVQVLLDDGTGSAPPSSA